MRLDRAEIARLPLPAALVDRRGGVVVRTPEWQGAAPGTVSYHTGQARLLVGPGVPALAEQEAVVRLLLDEVRAAVASMPAEQAICAAVLAGGLELVAGWPAEVDAASAADVLGQAVTVIRTRVPEVDLQVGGEATGQEVPSPSQVALALLQLATNAYAHEGVTSLRLRVGIGPTFYVEWPSAHPAGGVPAGQSHSALRRRWGLGYVRRVADALGATALPVGPTAPGWSGACLSLGSRRLTLPLAFFSGAQLVRCTQTWEQGMRSLDPAVADAIQADLRPVLAAAQEQPGLIVRSEMLSARRTVDGTWVALPPETGPDRVREVLRGLDHERALWTAPEPSATRVHGLISALGRSLGDPARAYAPEAFARELPRACAALGMPVPAVGPLLACPDPRATAFLLAELGGELVAEPDGTFLAPGPRSAGSSLPALLGPDDRGWIRLTPG